MKKKMAFLITSLTLIVMPVMCFAEGETGVQDIDVSGVFNTVTSNVSDAITDVLPYAAVVLGAMLAVSLGMKIYRRVVGR